ncbi:MAG: ATP synthase F1 subunit delta [Pseudomonadota bacterium]
MISSSITRRYAEALIGIGVEEDSCAQFESELTEINTVLKENTALRNILYSSVYPVVSRKGILREVTSQLGTSQTIENFLNLLIDKNRTELLPSISLRYGEMLDQLLGRIRAKVIVAKSISPELISNLKGAFEKLTAKEVVFEIEEDPAIIGGIITKLGNVIFDGSIRTHLEKIKRSIIRGEEG